MVTSDLQLGDEEVIQWITWCIYSINIPMIPNSHHSSGLHPPPPLSLPRVAKGPTVDARNCRCPEHLQQRHPGPGQLPPRLGCLKQLSNTSDQIWPKCLTEKHLKNSWKLPFESLDSTPMCLDHLGLAIAICTSSSLAWLETASCGNF